LLQKQNELNKQSLVQMQRRILGSNAPYLQQRRLLLVTAKRLKNGARIAKAETWTIKSIQARGRALRGCEVASWRTTL
jgi:hypothetical protein